MDMDVMQDVQDNFEQITQAFISWTVNAGLVISPKIELVDHRGQHAGRAVVAKDDIAEDEDLFSIPRSAVLSPDTSSLWQKIDSKPEDPWAALILTLIHEHLLGPSSSWWKPYLDVLPTKFDTPIFWSESETRQLGGSAMVKKIGRDTADEMFKSKIIPVVREHTDVFRASVLTDVALLGLCHRMGSAIMAYAFDLERDKNVDQSGRTEEDDGWEEDSDDGAPLPMGMVPMADMLNADADRNNAKLFYEKDKLVMRSIKSISAGEEIFNDYGALPTADLVRRYGYVTPNYAQYDVVEVEQDRVKSVAKGVLKISDEEMSRRLQYLEAEIPVDAFDIARPGAEEGQFPIELLAILRCFAMSQADFDKVVAKNKIPERGLAKDERMVLQCLLTIIQERAKDYPAPAISQSQEELEERSAYRHHMATCIIKGEQTVLQEALDTIKSMLADESTKRKHPSTHEQAQTKRQKR